jgi:hypothetical protein
MKVISDVLFALYFDLRVNQQQSVEGFTKIKVTSSFIHSNTYLSHSQIVRAWYQSAQMVFRLGNCFQANNSS